MSTNGLSGLGGLPSLLLYNAEIKNQQTPLANTAKDPQVKADISYFTTAIAKLKTPADFIANPKLVNFVLTAFGLQSQSGSMGIIKQVLTQDPTASSSLANQLADPRWQQLASALDFFHRGLSSLQSYTSASSQTIQTGSVTLPLNASPNFKIGQTVTFADSANPQKNFMVGAVTKITGNAVTISVPAGIGAFGSGTIKNWSVYANNPKSGGITTPASQVVSTLTQKYTTAQFENGLGDQSTPVQEAAYFLRNVGSVTSVYQLLGDRVMLDVVEGALGLPKNIAIQPIESQANLISSQLNIKTLANPANASYATATTDQATLQSTAQVTTAAQSALTSVVSQIQSIQQQYSFLAARTDPAGSNAAAIAVQQASVPALAQASGLIGAANNGLSSIQNDLNSLNQLVTQAGTADPTTLATDQALFQQLTQHIQSTLANSGYTSPADGSTGNLLTDTSLSVSATVKAGETITFNGLGLNAGTIASQLNAASSAFQSTIAGGSVDPTVSANLATLGTTFSTAKTQVTSELRDWNQGVQDSGTFLAPVDSGALNAGAAAGADAQSRASQVSTYILQLQAVAEQSADPTFTGDRNDLQTQATTLIGQINTAIGTPGSGVTDNLLTSAGSYDLIGGQSLTIRNAGLDTSIGANLSSVDISTQSGAQSLSDLISDTLQPALKTAQFQLSNDVGAVNTTLKTFDPRAPIDAQLKTLVANMASIETSAGANGQNLLSTSAKSIGVTLKTTGDNFVIRGQGLFDSQVNGVLQQAVAALSSSSTPPTALLQQAYGSALSIQSQLNGDVRNLANDTNKITALLAQQAKQNASNLTNPYNNATTAAKSLVQRYLALQDTQSQTTGSNSYLVSLFSGSSDNSITNIDLSGLAGLNFKT